MSGDDDGEKEHEATQKKLDDARLRGEVVQSADLVTSFAFAGLLGAAIWAGGWSTIRFGTAGMAFFDQAGDLGQALRSGDADPVPAMVWAMLRPLVTYLLLPGLLALLAILGQRAIVFAPEKLMPRLSRIDPFATARHRFGVEGLAEFAKGAIKMCVVGLLVATFIRGHLDTIMQTAAESPGVGSAILSALIIDFLVLVLIIMGGFGVIDYLWQRHRHLKRNRMSRQEMMDEFRQSEGDPHIKQQRRQRGHDIATNRMLADVPKADVVVVNPTHYAIALKWDRKGRRAPICVAKGVDETAARIREAAAVAGVPIHSDPPTARALHAEMEIGQEISPEHYRAVAAAIRFAETMRRRARSRMA